MGSGPVHKTNVNPSRTYYSSVVMTFAHLILFGLASDADKIDAVSVSRCVRKIVPQVCACCGHALTISQTSHVIPVYLHTAKENVRTSMAAFFRIDGLLVYDIPQHHGRKAIREKATPSQSLPWIVQWEQ